MHRFLVYDCHDSTRKLTESYLIEENHIVDMEMEAASHKVTLEEYMFGVGWTMTRVGVITVTGDTHQLDVFYGSKG